MFLGIKNPPRASHPLTQTGWSNLYSRPLPLLPSCRGTNHLQRLKDLERIYLWLRDSPPLLFQMVATESYPTLLFGCLMKRGLFMGLMCNPTPSAPSLEPHSAFADGERNDRPHG